MLITLLSIGLGKYLGLKSPQLYGELINHLTRMGKELECDSEDGRSIYKLLFQHAVCKFLSTALSEVRSGVFTSVTNRAMLKASTAAFEKLQEADLDSVLGLKSGELSAILEKSTKALGALMNNCVIRFVPMTIELSMLARKLSKQHQAQRMNWITWSTLATYFAFTLGYSSTRVRYRLSNSKAEGRLRGSVQESLLNSELSRLLGTGYFEVKRYRSHYNEVYKTALAVGQSLSKLNLGQQLVIQLGAFAAALASVDKVFMRSASVGDLVAVASTFNQIAGPLHFLGTMYREFRTNYSEVQKLQRLSQLRRSIADSPHAKPLLINRGTVDFQDVSFKYPNQERPLFENLNLKIHGGTKVAFVGPSGSGKSTLVKLLTRLYDIDDGKINICGQDLRTVTLRSLRDQVGIVPQDTVLFNDSIRNNILYGNWNASEHEIEAAVKAASLEDFIKNSPEGWDTRVGERGLRLSAGERQRVAIARCLLKRPRILVLDEATSNLDANTETQIMDSIKKLGRGKTVILIAHRLQAITDADQIFFVEEGRIVERGSHEELLDMRGKYASMWARQSQEESDDRLLSPAKRSKARSDTLPLTSAGDMDCASSGCNH